MDGNNILLNEKNGTAFRIIITEAMLVLIVILTLTAVKYFFGDEFSVIKAWYEINICADTDTDEVLHTAGGGIDEV